MSHREPSSLDYSSLLHVLSLNRWRHSILQEDWKQAERAAVRIGESAEPLWKWIGLVDLAMTRLYLGRSQEALALLHESAIAASATRPMSAWSDALAAHVLLEAGRTAEAVDQARLAEREGAGERVERDAIFLGALARARLGQWQAAEDGQARLERALKTGAASKETWRLDHLSGELALVRNAPGRAVELLERALASPPRVDVRLWFSLGAAYLAAGESAEAENWFTRILGSGEERLDWPIPYVRTFHFLGRLGEARGAEKWQEHYRRFVAHWADGDFDRDRVAEARLKSQQ